MNESICLVCNEYKPVDAYRLCAECKAFDPAKLDMRTMEDELPSEEIARIDMTTREDLARIGKVWLVSRSSHGLDDGIVGVFTTHDKARAFILNHPECVYRLNEYGVDSFISEEELDPEVYEQ